jgi:hypothetical protein
LIIITYAIACFHCVRRYMCHFVPLYTRKYKILSGFTWIWTMGSKSKTQMHADAFILGTEHWTMFKWGEPYMCLHMCIYIYVHIYKYKHTFKIL